MNLTLPLTPDEEARLLSKARTEGTTPERIIREAIQPILEAVDESLAFGKKAGLDKARAFRSWAESFPSDLPVLSLEDVSRENIYRRD
jgi:hypothetical protein